MDSVRGALSAQSIHGGHAFLPFAPLLLTLPRGTSKSPSRSCTSKLCIFPSNLTPPSSSELRLSDFVHECIPSTPYYT